MFWVDHLFAAMCFLKGPTVRATSHDFTDQLATVLAVQQCGRSIIDSSEQAGCQAALAAAQQLLPPQQRVLLAQTHWDLRTKSATSVTAS